MFGIAYSLFFLFLHNQSNTRSACPGSKETNIRVMVRGLGAGIIYAIILVVTFIIVAVVLLIFFIKGLIFAIYFSRLLQFNSYASC